MDTDKTIARIRILKGMQMGKKHSETNNNTQKPKKQNKTHKHVKNGSKTKTTKRTTIKYTIKKNNNRKQRHNKHSGTSSKEDKHMINTNVQLLAMEVMKQSKNELHVKL